MLFAGTDFPSALIMAAAAKPAFRILLVHQVEREARRVLREAGVEADLDRLLEACAVTRVPDATAEQLNSYLTEVWAAIRDEPDAKIGVALRCSPVRPEMFVSSNHRDWRPTRQAEKALGGCVVMRSRDFANLLVLLLRRLPLPSLPGAHGRGVRTPPGA